MAGERASSRDEIPRGVGVVEVYLRELSQLFNTLDPAPFHEKELDRDAEEYILSIAKGFPAGVPLALVVHLDQPAGLPDEERVLRDATHAHFAGRSQASRRRLRALFHQGRTSLVIGLLCLAASLIVGESIASRMVPGPLATVLRESFVIGGWVAMWRPLELLLYDWWPILGERRLYDRLSRLAVHIVAAGPRGPRPADPPEVPHGLRARDRNRPGTTPHAGV